MSRFFFLLGTILASASVIAETRPEPLTLADVVTAAAARHPSMTYRSRRIVPTGERTFRIEGDLTLRGVTRPVTLEARYNGGYAGHPMDPQARIGFSATGQLRRSEFGISYGIPAPGTTMGVGDTVELRIECEFSGPPLKGEPRRQAN